jgi:hypothetical protein
MIHEAGFLPVAACAVQTIIAAPILIVEIKPFLFEPRSLILFLRRFGEF